MLGKRKHSASSGATDNVSSKSRCNSVSNAHMGPVAPSAFHGVPRYVQYTSPVPALAPQDVARRSAALPLNLVAHIISYLADIGDIARVTRTSRLLYYMTLPRLYEHVNLHSYATMRYINGRPEGFGSGSPFMMALDGLATKAHAALVRHLRIWGCWNELGIEDFAKGRVPDNSMMLNIILRAATDKMTRLESFCWELDCKPLKTLYQGLATHSNLTAFTLRFPSTRVPRPAVLIPPMVNLRVFKALDIDPMCYPDDISMLMLGSKKLEDVRLHFSPRMRAEAESIMNLNMFFGRCHKANYKMKVKHFGLHNFFGPNVLGMEHVFDIDTCESVTFLDTFGNNNPKTIFIDETWKGVPMDLFTKFKRVRINELAPQHLLIMRNSKVSVEKYYIVNERRGKTGFTPPDNSEPTPNTDLSDDTDSWIDPSLANLKDDFLATVTKVHGEGIKHLLLSDQWPLTRDDVHLIARDCPQLEQLGLAVNTSTHDWLVLLMPFLKNLRALRVLPNEHLAEHFRHVSHEERMNHLGITLANDPRAKFELLGMGDVVYRVGRMMEDVQQDGTIVRRREVTMRGLEAAKGYAIWDLDHLDINVDPVAPFSP
ncbi:Hypothetical predicted protein [Lecanosticta acicola]|uniref:F-box domain-containing protein n=1 Tax=Lecanosticta acicola TaxID=111012 RepID=A0AAI8Z9K1_9PEZI|nr:Hypothetical predicted protein [Lecanosticta acicola]